MDIEFNNIANLDTNGTGWFVGFGDWIRDSFPDTPDLRYMPQEQRSHSLCVKWMRHPVNDPRGGAKPPSAGRTLSILVSPRGRFTLEFSQEQDFPEGRSVRHTLRNHGDFVIWGAGLHHRWFVDAECTILTLRWVPDESTGS